jgi:DNA invertase Pin-like site-specific DNA recombinase
VTDVSRLARNCTDWFSLLDLASLRGCLISDTGGVYDPRLYDEMVCSQMTNSALAVRGN